MSTQVIENCLSPFITVSWPAEQCKTITSQSSAPLKLYYLHTSSCGGTRSHQPKASSCPQLSSVPVGHRPITSCYWHPAVSSEALQQSGSFLKSFSALLPVTAAQSLSPRELGAVCRAKAAPFLGAFLLPSFFFPLMGRQGEAVFWEKADVFRSDLSQLFCSLTGRSLPMAAEQVCYWSRGSEPDLKQALLCGRGSHHLRGRGGDLYRRGEFLLDLLVRQTGLAEPGCQILCMAVY